jgi:hypothetical protein
VWLLRLEGDDKARLLAASRLLRGDVRMAQHLLDNLPRLIARGVTPDAGRKLVQQIQALNGTGHACASGETPDFKELTRAAVRKAVASRQRLSGDVAAEAARAVQDAAMLRWPEDVEPHAWETEDAQLPPPVPTPVRHSASRIATVLAVTIVVLAGGATAYWTHYGTELTRVSAASWRTPDAGAVAADQAEPADAGIADDVADAAVPTTTPSDEAVLAPVPK